MIKILGNCFQQVLWAMLVIGLTHNSFSQSIPVLAYQPDTIQVQLIDQQQRVWLGNAQGLYLIEGKIKKHFTQKNGLINHQITALAAGTGDEVWIGTEEGVLKYNQGKFTNFTFKDGLINKQIRDFHRDQQNRLWVIHAKGAQWFDAQGAQFRLEKKLADLPILAVFEQATALTFLTNQQVIRLPYQTAYWNTAWFRNVLVLLGMLLGVSGVMYYNRMTQQKLQLAKQQAQSEQKALLAQMNPHFIFNALNSIQRFIAHNNVEQASIYLSRFSNLLRITLENSRKGFVSLEDELQNLELYLRLEFLRFENRFSYSIENQADWFNQSEIPTMLLQPFVENAIWHGLMNKDTQDGYIKIKVEASEQYLHFSIQDNGVGRKKATAIKAQKTTQHRSRGLEIIRERIELLNRKNDLPIQLEIRDLNEREGTEVKLAIPLEE